MISRPPDIRRMFGWIRSSSKDEALNEKQSLCCNGVDFGRCRKWLGAGSGCGGR
jgi:hypothetical protein